MSKTKVAKGVPKRAQSAARKARRRRYFESRGLKYTGK